MGPGLLCWGNFLCEEEEGMVFFVLQGQGVFWILTHSLLSGLLSIRIREIPQYWVGRLDASEHLEQCDYTFWDWGLLLLLVLFGWFGFFKGRRGKGDAWENQMWSTTSMLTVLDWSLYSILNWNQLGSRRMFSCLVQTLIGPVYLHTTSWEAGSSDPLSFTLHVVVVEYWPLFLFVLKII